MTYARTTSVPISRTRAEIEEMVVERGAGQFMSAIDTEKSRAMIGWTMGGRMVRLEVPLPDRKAKEFVHPKYRGSYQTWREYTDDTQQRLWDQACRSRWRAILLIVRAKFEAIEAGITTFEREFLADTVLADGRTLGAYIEPQLKAMYDTGSMPALLPAHEER